MSEHRLITFLFKRKQAKLHAYKLCITCTYACMPHPCVKNSLRQKINYIRMHTDTVSCLHLITSFSVRELDMHQQT